MTNATNTPDERLTMAFEDLDGQDIFAKERYYCCQSCGCAAVSEEADAESRGYVFYHEQDAESKDAGDDFYLAFGTFGSLFGPTTSEQLGAEIVATLKAHGIGTAWNSEQIGAEIVATLKAHSIGTDWNGNADTRIRVLWRYQ